MNEPVCLNLSILELSKMVMHDFWYDCVKAIYKKKMQIYVTWIEPALQNI